MVRFNPTMVEFRKDAWPASMSVGADRASLRVPTALWSWRIQNQSSSTPAWLPGQDSNLK